jgi:hypothetical protein
MTFYMPTVSILTLMNRHKRLWNPEIIDTKKM